MSEEIHVTPEPTPEARAAILRAVEELLEREAERARPSTWALAGWSHRRSGMTDFGRWLEPGHRWVLSARLPWGGQEYPGLYGRGDAK